MHRDSDPSTRIIEPYRFSGTLAGFLSFPFSTDMHGNEYDGLETVNQFVHQTAELFRAQPSEPKLTGQRELWHLTGVTPAGNVKSTRNPRSAF